MITLPKTPRNRAIFRVMTMPEGSWGGTQTWTALPIPLIIDRSTGGMVSGTVAQGGIHVKSISRWCLPDEDRADFYIDTGLINGVTVTAPDLTGLCIRFQVLDDDTQLWGYDSMPTSGWKTVFVGSLIYTENREQVGLRQMGRTTYYCAGVLWRTRSWPLDRHATADVSFAKGNPGYNVALHGWFRKVLGNKDTTAAAVDPFGDLSGTPDIHTYFRRHAMPVDGSGTTTGKWTDEEVVQHALASSRSAGEPKITTQLTNGFFSGTYSWSVSAGDTCWDLLRRVCNRQRGRGAVFLDYTDENTSGGNVGLALRARKPFKDAIYYDYVDFEGELALSGTYEIPGAEKNVDAIDIDLNGDHRITDDGLQYDNRLTSAFDHVTTQGEPIQVTCNLNFYNSSLEKRWSATDESAFGAIADENYLQRLSPRWNHVWRRFGVPVGWAKTVKAQPSGTSYSIDYSTDEDGALIVGATNGNVSTPLTFRVLPDVPIYEGWRYDGATMARWDGAKDYMPPSRMRPQILYKADDDAGSDAAWYPLDLAGFNLQMDDYGMFIANPGVEDGVGYRLLANPTDAPNMPNAWKQLNIAGVTTTSGLQLSLFNTIVGVELGTRVSFSTPGAYTAQGRRLTNTIGGVHLWVGAPGAMWSLDWTRAAAEQHSPAFSFQGTDPYITRDDRNELSFIHALSVAYYTKAHNPGTWSLKDCGLMTLFSTLDGQTIYYPELGQLVDKVKYAGEQGAETSATLDTAITSIHYDHDAGVTTWRTDYVSYDGNTQ